MLSLIKALLVGLFVFLLTPSNAFAQEKPSEGKVLTIRAQMMAYAKAVSKATGKSERAAKLEFCRRRARGLLKRHKAKKKKKPTRAQIDKYITSAAHFYGIDKRFIHAVITIESRYKPFVISSAGAMGLMQLMPTTASALGVKDPFDAKQNVYGGTKLLYLLIKRYKGDINKVVAAYHTGHKPVDRAGGIPFSQTHMYVSRVVRRYKALGGGTK